MRSDREHPRLTNHDQDERMDDLYRVAMESLDDTDEEDACDEREKK